MIFIERPKIEDALDEPARKHLATRANEAASLKSKSTIEKEKKKKDEANEKSEKNPITSRWTSFQQGKGADNPHGPQICDAVKSFCRCKCAYCELSSAATIDHI